MVRAISNNNDPKPGVRSEFTPTSATKMLPLVRRIAADMLHLTHAIAAQREQIREIDQLPETSEHVDYQDELSDIRGTLADDEKRLDDCRRELSSLGLEAHVPFDGAIDFPSILNRRRVQLCWHPEDDRVEHWHEAGQPRQDRKKIGSLEFGVSSHNN
jgi:hypothetical protein